MSLDTKKECLITDMLHRLYIKCDIMVKEEAAKSVEKQRELTFEIKALIMQ